MKKKSFILNHFCVIFIVICIGCVGSNLSSKKQNIEFPNQLGVRHNKIAKFISSFMNDEINSFTKLSGEINNLNSTEIKVLVFTFAHIYWETYEFDDSYINKYSEKCLNFFRFPLNFHSRHEAKRIVLHSSQNTDDLRKIMVLHNREITYIDYPFFVSYNQKNDEMLFEDSLIMLGLLLGFPGHLEKELFDKLNKYYKNENSFNYSNYINAMDEYKIMLAKNFDKYWNTFKDISELKMISNGYPADDLVPKPYEINIFGEYEEHVLKVLNDANVKSILEREKGSEVPGDWQEEK